MTAATTMRNGAAVAGQTVDLFARVSDGPEEPVDDFAITQAGVMQSLDLPADPPHLRGDCDDDGDLADLVVFQSLFTRAR